MKSTAWWEYVVEQAWEKIQTEHFQRLSKTDGIVVGADYKVKIYDESNWQKEYRSRRDAKRVNNQVKLGSTQNKRNIAGT